ncbi:xylulokinase [Pararhodobacter aggregans]|uniref:Xylulose kinase n=1 Tax=Pararhodobacter aggregans TaxID=404875 RepID=A0A2T7USC3_9RHOB|nr:xylulokinase [Pararhodobacter aggregans]PTX00231.1 xylulokinase [Pararhodobacter aggregans]PVE47552.1 xylulokinase [Pararhodobacter aggregans]
MYIGLDLGTSSLKAILIDVNQNVLAEHSVPLTVQRPHDGWSEQDPQSWVSAAREALGAIRARNECRGLRGIGLSGHMHGAVLLDAEDQVLRPCLLWNDTRSHAEAAEMDADPGFRAITGNIVFPGFTAPKVEWVRRHEPEIFARTAKILLPKDYLRLALTGNHVSEMSDAAGTAWFDTARRDWSDELLAVCGLSREHMPRLVEGSAPSGELRDKLAIELDLPSVVVAGGGGDNAAAAIGAGVVHDGSAFLSLGTSGVLFAANDGYRPDPATAVHTFCHAVPGTWHQMGVILAATDALNWLSRLTGQSAAQLTQGLGPVTAPGRALFLPYLGGERTPLNDAQIRGQFLHLDHATDAQAAARAVMEGVAYAFADCRDALAATGTTISRALAIGGGARSGYWLDVLATTLGFPLDVPAQGEFGAAMGAARLGMMAATGAGAEIATPPPVARSHDPDPHLAPAFAEAHQRYKAAYAAIRNL